MLQANLSFFRCFAVIPLLLMGLSACELKVPRVHKVSVQQGNVITQEMIDRLKPGMTRSQVAYVMGEPVIENTFNPDRWDYVYTIDVPGYYNQMVQMTLYFENDVLAYFTGDLAPSDAVGEESTDESSEDAETQASDNA